MTFRNPILPSGQDPFITYHNGWYYYCHVVNPVGWTPIFVAKSKTLLGIRDAEHSIVWTPPLHGEASRDQWAPELHFVRGKWYIYVAAWSGKMGEPHKMYVLEGNTRDPQKPFSLKGELVPKASSVWAIDGTVFEDDGAIYYVWSGKDASTPGLKDDSGTPMLAEQNLYISRMENPWMLSGPSVKISTPIYSWERTEPHPVNEGPQILKRNGNIFIIYSAGSTLTDDYCLGMLVHTAGDMLDPKTWVKGPEPVFAKTETVFGPGHASFATTKDATEDWIVYHAAKFSGGGLDRQVHTQKFEWVNDRPVFGKPIDLHEEIALPADEYAYLYRHSTDVTYALRALSRLPLLSPLRRYMPGKIKQLIKKKTHDIP